MVMRLVALLACILAVRSPSSAQEKSVRPGINDPFKNPDAKEWVTKFEGESREVYDRRKEIVAACELKPGQSVADVGAGTGLFTRLFAEEVKNDGTVYAVDIAQKFLDHIAASAKRQNLKNIKTILGTDVSAGLKDESVDAVFICDTYHHFEFPQRMMTSLHRSLKTGGRVVLIDFARTPDKSSDWVLKHVRAGQDVVEKEITECGFRKVKEVKDILKENYIVVFEKVVPKAKSEK
jgi:ubiquinone/menaquinone biosynthesis C-methylase UbiE